MSKDIEETKLGRPTKFKEEYIEEAYKLSLLGLTDIQMAKFFEVAESTFHLWKLEHPNFSESLKRGKLKADMEIVDSLRQTCFDRQIPEVQAFKTKNIFYNAEGKRMEEEKIEMVETARGVPADFKSIALWLGNRHPELWSSKPTTNVELNIPNILQNNPLSNDKGNDSTSEDI